MKRLITAFIIAASAVTCFAQRTFTQGYQDYTVISETDRTVSVKAKGAKYENGRIVIGESPGDVVIPGEVTDGSTIYTVVKIEGPGFYGCKGMTSVTIHDNITEMDGQTFGWESSIESFTFPRNMKEIDYGILQFSKTLKEVFIPEGVEKTDLPIMNCPNVTDIYCYPVKAPILPLYSGIYSYNNHGYEPKGDIKIHIPKGATGYDSGAWKEHYDRGEIFEDIESGVQGAAIEDKNIYGGTGSLNIYSPEDGIVRCVSINGITQDLKVAKGENIFQLPAGVYIVNGNKVIVK